MHGVERWLPDFLASVDAQRGIDLARVEVVAVDDGSPDGSVDLLRTWQRMTRARVVVLQQDNAGQAAARNTGLDAATGEWVGFPDPDDVLHPDFLSSLLAAAGRAVGTDVVAGSLWQLSDATGRVTDTHPLRHRFAAGERTVDLAENPACFFGSSAVALFRHSLVGDLRFDARIRPHFEDAHFVLRYLLALPRPLLTLVPAARYHYRRRADGSSTMQTSLAHPGRYLVVPRLAYLDLLDRSVGSDGRAPAWVQQIVLYELSWYFYAEQQMGGTATAARGEVGQQFLGLLREVADRLDPQLVQDYRSSRLDDVWRVALLHGLSGEPWAQGRAVVRQDRARRLQLVRTRFTGDEPSTTYDVDGDRVTAVHTKLVEHRFFGSCLVRDRLSWVPAGALVVRVDGEPLPLAGSDPGELPVPSGDVRQRLRRQVADPREALRLVQLRVRGRLGRWRAGEFAGAWVLLDRVHDARDSAEIVFEHLRVHRPEVNAFFVVEAGTPDFERLSGRWGSRVVAYGSRRWLRLMLNCTDVISSHADVPVVRPPAVVRALWPGKPRWRVSFLQHGVIKDDLSAWLNPKRLDLFVVSTPGELASVVGDGSSYAYTSKEVVLTGLPRFDRLLEQARAVPPEQRDLLLVAPTWRHSLLPPLAAGSQRRSVHADFLESEYARQWWGLLTSERLRVAAVAAGVRVAFLPHPNMSSVLELLELPEHVVALSFDDGDVQELFARAAVLVTDYSSMAFNVALLDRPVVYFPFDLAAVQAGAHVGRVGYFDYGRDGFGPVACELGALLSELEGVLARGCVSEPVYAERAAQAFGGVRDGRCTERVVQALLDLRVPYDPIR